MVAEKSEKSDIARALEKLHPRVWRFCLALTGDRGDADDLVQQTCLRALEKQAHYREQGTLDRWLFTLARRLWYNECRARKTRAGTGRVPAEDAGLVAVGPDAETNILAAEMLTKIMALGSEQRLAVLLVYGEGQTYREAAEILECPIGTIMSRLSAARARLNRAYTEEVDD